MKNIHAQLNFITINTITLTPFKFQIKYLCTQEFKEWWYEYRHSHFAAFVIVLQLLTDALSFVQTLFKKSTGTHIKELYAFQCYFEVVYNPFDIRRTIYDANLILKQKKSSRNFQF